MQKEITINLDFPVIVDGQEYKSITLKSFKAKHFKYLPDEFYEMADDSGEKFSVVEMAKIAPKMIPLIAAMGDVLEEVVGEFEVADLFKVMGEFAPFLGQSLSATIGSS